MAASPEVPGWYPDSDDPSRMRHWDGEHWGAERRPRPSWAVGPPASGDGSGSRRRGRWIVWAGGAGALALAFGMLVASLSRGPKIPPRTVGDGAFTRQADAECRRTLPALRRDRPEPGPEGGRTAGRLAVDAKRAADRLDAMVGRLGALPVAPADQAEVDGWLADWRAYTDVGHRYAVALGDARVDEAADVAADGDPLSRRIFLFARANGMPTCTP